MCGIIGVVGRTEAAPLLYGGLSLLQHRGQDAAGIVTGQNKGLFRRKGSGLVRDVFSDPDMAALVGSIGIGHVRYPTAGCSSSAAEAQPLYVNSPYGITMGHNGNLTNTAQIIENLFKLDRRHVNTSSDSEALLNVFAHELQMQDGLELQPKQVFRAVAGVHQRCRGAYACVAVVAGYGLVAFRDPYGIRPLVYGTRQTENGLEHMVASESVALQAQGFDVERDVAPGEVLYITASDEDGAGGQVHAKQCAAHSTLNPCIFEHVYLARPDSIIDEVSVYKARLRMGETLAKKIRRECPTLDADVVIPIPETSRTTAQELGNTLGLKVREGFVKNRYVGRTFIMPGQQQRAKSVRRKLNPIALEFQEKHVLLVDDSIVRGTTCRQIIELAREAGAAKVTYCSAAPPVRYPNVYGIDMPAAQELIAHGRTVEQVRELIGADGLIYQDLDDLIECARKGNPGIPAFECSVFSGEYVTGDVDEAYLVGLERQRSDAAKLARDKEHAQGMLFAAERRGDANGGGTRENGVGGAGGGAEVLLTDFGGDV